MRNTLYITYPRTNDHSNVNIVLGDLCIKKVLRLTYEVICQTLRNMLLPVMLVERSKLY